MNKCINKKINKINQLKVVEYDTCGEEGTPEIIYIHVAKTVQNIKVLRELGMTDKYLNDYSYDDVIDIAEFAFMQIRAKSFCVKDGFSFK